MEFYVRLCVKFNKITCKINSIRLVYAFPHFKAIAYHSLVNYNIKIQQLTKNRYWLFYKRMELLQLCTTTNAYKDFSSLK